MRIGRRTMWGLVAVAAMLAAGCTGPTTSEDGGAGPTRANTVIFAKTDAGPTWVRNFNAFSPAIDKSPGWEMLYEPLVRRDYSDGGAVKPWLAKSWQFDAAGTTVTFTLRDDVKFSNGSPMTADDVVYSLSLPLSDPKLNAAGATYTSVDKVDDHTVAAHFAQPSFSELQQFASPQLPVVPKSIWSGKDLSTWTNPDPVGTGLLTLHAFDPQQLTFKTNDAYWGGAAKARYVKIIPSTGDTARAQLLRGDVDWTLMGWAGAKEEYVAKNPATNLYQLYATGGAYSMVFNTGKAPFDDVHVRRALAMTIDRTAIVTTLKRPGTEAGPTGLVDQVYSAWLKPEYRNKTEKLDAEGAKRELAAGGWSITGGKLAKDGKTYAPTLLFNQDYGWAAYADIMAKTWKQSLGLTVAPAGQPGANMYDQQNRGKFDLTIATTGGAGVYGVYSQLSSHYVKPLGQKAAANQGRWNDPRTDGVLAQMASTADPNQLRTLSQQMQQIVVEQVPYTPLYNSYWFVTINASHWTGWPTPEKFSYVPFPPLGQDATQTLLHLTPAGK